MQNNLLTFVFSAAALVVVAVIATTHAPPQPPLPLKTADLPYASREVKEAAARPPGVSTAGVFLASTSVDLPTTGRTFAGPGSDVVNANCTSCHSAGMVLTQPQLSRATWTEEVNKMRGTYKAPVAAEDVPAIVDYLAALHGGS